MCNLPTPLSENPRRRDETRKYAHLISQTIWDYCTGSQQTLSSTALIKSPKNVNFNKTFPRTYQQKKNSFLDEKKGQHCTIWFWNSYEVHPFPPVLSYNSKYLFPLKDTIQNTHSGYRPVSSTLAPALACRPHNIGSPRFDVTL